MKWPLYDVTNGPMLAPLLPRLVTPSQVFIQPPDTTLSLAPSKQEEDATNFRRGCKQRAKYLSQVIIWKWLQQYLLQNLFTGGLHSLKKAQQ